MGSGLAALRVRFKYTCANNVTRSYSARYFIQRTLSLCMIPVVALASRSVKLCQTCRSRVALTEVEGAGALCSLSRNRHFCRLVSKASAMYLPSDFQRSTRLRVIVFATRRGVRYNRNLLRLFFKRSRHGLRGGGWPQGLTTGGSQLPGAQLRNAHVQDSFLRQLPRRRS